jgi:omega-6 fatty acid desaturase (delta-12 desaturase)
MTAFAVASESIHPSEETSAFRLRHILATLPKEVFQKDWRKAWLRVLISVSVVGLCYWGLAVSPWYGLPVLWFITGTALTGFFIIGHDCGHRSFAQRKWINNWVGHLLFLPLLYPFFSWKYLHDHHHKHTNKLAEDNAWDPFLVEDYQTFNPALRWGYRRLRQEFWWLASIVHWGVLHFNWQQFRGKRRRNVQISVLLVVITAAIGFPLLWITVGWWGIMKFWLMPWLGYHFWMSTFTLVHHTNPNIHFSPPASWDEAKAQLFGTVHCTYPRWVEILCHDINVHIPHHVCTAIPSYNLPQAYQHLRQEWGPQLVECKFGWDLMRSITRQCHLYDPERGYYLRFEELR